MKAFGLIMAGGDGTRFWPLSRRKRPKQLIAFDGEKTLLETTITNLCHFLPMERIHIISGQAQKDEMEKILNCETLVNNIIYEPFPRNTAACIGLAALKIQHKYGNQVMCVFPADHHIGRIDQLSDLMTQVINYVERNDDVLVTIGIEPTYPATGYGYIEVDSNSSSFPQKIIKFTEKPEIETAVKFIKSGNYLWNSGMFIWKTNAILERIQKYLPQTYAALEIIKTSLDTPQEKQIIEQQYMLMPKVSIDNGIMEKDPNAVTFLGSFGWSDIGTWEGLGEIKPKDVHGNIVQGNCLCLDTYNSIIFSEKRLIATLGISGLVVVETEDAILVCSKESIQEVKGVVEQLKKIKPDSL